MAIISKTIRILRLIKNWIRNKYDSKRTKTAGFGLLLLSIAYGLPLIEPRTLEYLPEGNWEKSAMYFIGALLVWGIGGKLEKIKDSLESMKNSF